MITSAMIPLLPIGGVTMDVGVWLRNLGLSRYEAAFRENSIDADVLPDLTDGDLAQLGVNLGDRKRLLKAIAGLGTAEPLAPPSSPTDYAERRPITVMFCDLVGSTWLRNWTPRIGAPQRVSRRSFGGSDRSWRTCAEETRRRANGSLRLSEGAGERRRTRGDAWQRRAHASDPNAQEHCTMPK